MISRCFVVVKLIDWCIWNGNIRYMLRHKNMCGRTASKEGLFAHFNLSWNRYSWKDENIAAKCLYQNISFSFALMYIEQKRTRTHRRAETCSNYFPFSHEIHLEAPRTSSAQTRLSPLPAAHRTLLSLFVKRDNKIEDTRSLINTAKNTERRLTINPANAGAQDCAN